MVRRRYARQAQLRRACLETVLREQLAVDIDDGGIAVHGTALRVSWARIDALAGAGSDTVDGRLRAYLPLLAHLAPLAGGELLHGLFPHAADTLPSEWALLQVPGGVLGVGAAVSSELLTRGPMRVATRGPMRVPVPVPPSVLHDLPLPTNWWDTLLHLLEEASGQALDSLDRRWGHARTPLRPAGAIDVPTLLASPAYRAWLARDDGAAVLTVPLRTRAWRLDRVDAALGPALRSLAREGERGPGVLRVTAHGVCRATPADVRAAVERAAVDRAGAPPGIPARRRAG